MIDVQLLDVYYREGVIYLIIRDISSNRVFTIEKCLECHKNNCTWVLIDLDYFVDIINAKAIRQYCGNCESHKQKSNSEIKQKLSKNNLLDFDF